MDMSSTALLEQDESHSARRDSKKLKRYLGIILVVTFILAILVVVLAILYTTKDTDSVSSKGTEPPSPTTPTSPNCTARPTAGTPSQPPSHSDMPYTNAAVAADDLRCSKVGRDVLKDNGSAVDAAVATMFCLGVINMHSTGIGGGGFMVVYTRQNRSAQFFNFRETAPSKATKTMYVNKTGASHRGGLAIAVPGEVKGMFEAWKIYGKLPWKRLVEPAIKFAREGFVIHKALYSAINSRRKIILDELGLREILVENGCLKREGDLLVNRKLAITLERISNDPMSFYEGDLAEDIVNDVVYHNGILTLEDLKKYSVEITPAINVSFNEYNLLTSGLPSSGIVLAFILNVLKGHNFTAEDFADDRKALTYHRIIEAFKYAYARRALLGDKRFLNITETYNELLDDAYAESIRLNISDNRTYHDPKHYGGYYENRGITGTTHLSVLASNGDAVSVTATINTYFGSKVRSTVTGITYNNEMDDFSTPGLVNYFGVDPSPSNFIKPGKRPMSSMNPAIFVNKTSGDVVFIVGAAGGTRITTATALVVMNKLWFGLNTSTAVEAPRFHHQLSPDVTAIERPTAYQLPADIVGKLRGFGHNCNVQVKSYKSVVQAISKEINGDIYAKSDPRKGGYPAGF